MSVKLTAKSPSRTWFWIGLLLYMMGIALYFLGRFHGYWAESDSATFTRVMRNFIEQGKLVPGSGLIYPNGYAYQAVSIFVVSLTGLSVENLQQLIYPLLAIIIVLPAWIAYRELTGSQVAATLATLLLITQPEFLFVILRSSHEKFTRTLMLICFFLLARSISPGIPRRTISIYVGLFCLTSYALITNNFLLANSFVLATATVYGVGWILGNFKPNLKMVNGNLANRLIYIIPVCCGLVYLFTFHIYPPARHNFLVLRNTWDGIAMLILGAQDQSSDVYVAYKYVTFGWVNLQTYFLLSIANWIVLVASFAIWSHQGWNWIVRSRLPKNQTAWLLWLFYTAFMVQGGLAVISDASGALSSNVQLRLFPSFSMIGVALVSAQLVEWRPLRFKRALAVGLASALFSLSILSVWKATNEPLFSNKWNFYHPNEILAMRWGDRYLRNAEVWTEFDERLIAAYETESGDTTYNLTTTITSRTRDILISSIIRLRSIRVGQPLPVPPDALQVYDNGTAQLYHLRPRTPYQP